MSVLFKSGLKFLPSGCPLYHHTNSLAECTPIKSYKNTNTHTIMSQTKIIQPHQQHSLSHDQVQQHSNLIKQTYFSWYTKSSITFSTICKHNLLTFHQMLVNIIIHKKTNKQINKFKSYHMVELTKLG